jgi:hypothetical protein
MAWCSVKIRGTSLPLPLHLQLPGPKQQWEFDTREIVLEAVKVTELFRFRVQWRSFVRSDDKLSVPVKVKNFFMT